MGLSRSIADFAAEIGDGSDPVHVFGSGSRLGTDVGTRCVEPPSGIVEFQPDEMTVRCGARTPIAELLATVATSGQFVNLPDSADARGTVGGALAVGRTGPRRLGHGPVRDSLLQTVHVDHRGRVIRAGGPTVKNVSGFDLARLHVGTYGVFGFLAEVILRTRPTPIESRWLTAEVDDPTVASRLVTDLHRPTAVLWDGNRVWVCLEGHPLDIDESAAGLSRAGITFSTSAEPDLSGHSHRWSTPAADAVDVAMRQPGHRVVELGVGIVHDRAPTPVRAVEPPNAIVIRRLLDEFNPGRRLNPSFVDLVQ